VVVALAIAAFRVPLPARASLERKDLVLEPA
jgi:hypothetical protein